MNIIEGNNQLNVSLVPQGIAVTYVFPNLIGGAREWKFTTVINDWQKVVRVSDTTGTQDWSAGYGWYAIEVPIPTIAPPATEITPPTIAHVTANLKGETGTPGGVDLTEEQIFYAWTPGTLTFFRDMAFVEGALTKYLEWY